MEDDACRVSSGLLGIATSLIRQKKDPAAEDVQQAISNGLRRGRWHSDKQALQNVLTRLELNEEDTVVYKGSRLAVPPSDQWQRIILAAHHDGERHLSVGNTWKAVSLADDDAFRNDCFSCKVKLVKSLLS